MSKSDGIIDLRAIGVYAALAITKDFHGAHALSQNFHSTRFFCEEGLKDLRKAKVLKTKRIKLYDHIRTVNSFIEPEHWKKEMIPPQNLALLLTLYKDYVREPLSDYDGEITAEMWTSDKP